MIRLPKGGYAPVFELRPGPKPRISSGAPRDHRTRRTGDGWRSRWAWPRCSWSPSSRGAPASGAPPTPATPVATIAVLPFEVFSADPDQQLLAARLTDGVTSDLARLGTLGVVSRTSALQFAGARRPIREVAKALGADLVLEASVEVNGEVVRVSGRLVDAAVDRKIWVEDFVGRTSDLRDLQQRIAAATAAAAAHRGRPKS